jgi:hypothetical protein
MTKAYADKGDSAEAAATTNYALVGGGVAVGVIVLAVALLNANSGALSCAVISDFRFGAARCCQSRWSCQGLGASKLTHTCSAHLYLSTPGAGTVDLSEFKSLTDYAAAFAADL